MKITKKMEIVNSKLQALTDDDHFMDLGPRILQKLLQAGTTNLILNPLSKLIPKFRLRVIPYLILMLLWLRIFGREGKNYNPK